MSIALQCRRSSTGLSFSARRSSASAFGRISSRTRSAPSNAARFPCPRHPITYEDGDTEELSSEDVESILVNDA
eukprot:3799055-Prymnesium_polylepis.1